MSKKTKQQLKANLYENDYDYFEEELEAPVTKFKHITNTVVKKIKPIVIQTIGVTEAEKKLELQNKVFGGKISDKTVSCNCNKCGHHINGILVSTIYSPISDLVTPFISYECSYCKHIGYRSVKEKSLIAKEFDAIYF
jgi:hypothetical protein